MYLKIKFRITIYIFCSLPNSSFYPIIFICEEFIYSLSKIATNAIITLYNEHRLFFQTIEVV